MGFSLFCLERNAKKFYDKQDKPEAAKPQKTTKNPKRKAGEPEDSSKPVAKSKGKSKKTRSS